MAKAREAQGSPSPEECLEMGRMCACYNLRRAARAVTHLYDQYFDEVGLKATQYTVLAVLAHAEDEAPTITDLAASMVLEQSSLSRNLAVLERLGHVRLVPGEDRRERVVTLTRSGRAAVAQGYPVWKRAQAAITSSLEVEQLDGHLRALRRLTHAAVAALPASGARGARGDAKRDRPRERK